MIRMACDPLLASCGAWSFALLAVAIAGVTLGAQTAAPSSDRPARDGQADFDFLIGSWKVHNRRLKQPLSGSTEWYEFTGTNVAHKIWDGSGNMDEYDGDAPQGRIRGLTVRLYDHKTGQWRIYWANRANGTMDAPMLGSFTNGRGEFYSHETFNGRGVLVRFIWTTASTNACRWEQAFSADGGRTWETNWIMEMTRAEG